MSPGKQLILSAAHFLFLYFIGLLMPTCYSWHRSVCAAVFVCCVILLCTRKLTQRSFILCFCNILLHKCHRLNNMDRRRWLHQRIYGVLHERGKYGTEVRPAFILNVPYLFLPVWAGIRIFREKHAFPKIAAERVTVAHSEGIFQRPLDFALILYLLGAITFTLFRGMLALDCPSDSCFTYIYQYEPYIRDPVAYPKVQMLVNMFYLLPFLCVSIYALLFPGCTWMLDWAVVYAGAVAQSQFAHIGSSIYHRTPYTYRVPEESWWEFMILNVLYTLGMQLLAYRCIQNPAYFLKDTKQTVEEGKKQD
ncbi:transmembrane 6 superfamily member 2 isoform X2 [Hyla sarda]|uniref:transmembrane 6 superfamily member 2 isoform X2 n=1 Tax=Hyla sarda TaxID=327740 RepID=UPI0024C34488|nr:transmembrane 6 superfamily member 2 isoform X2 [Hyla sarda]